MKNSGGAVVKFRVGGEEYPIAIIDQEGVRWVLSKQVGEALGNTRIRKLIRSLEEKDELIRGKHISHVKWRMPSDTQRRRYLCLSWRGIIRVAMRSEGKRAKEFRDWAEDVLYKVMMEGKYVSPGVSKAIVPSPGLSFQVLTWMFEKGRFTIGELAGAFDVSSSMSRSLVVKMVRSGYLSKVVSGSPAVYEVRKPMLPPPDKSTRDLKLVTAKSYRVIPADIFAMTLGITIDQLVRGLDFGFEWVRSFDNKCERCLGICRASGSGVYLTTFGLRKLFDKAIK